MEKDDILKCLKCGYEVPRLKALESRKKSGPPVCPNCNLDLSFKDAGMITDTEHPATRWMILGFAALVGILAGMSLIQHFKTFDHRKLITAHASPGTVFYGGSTRSKIPGEWTSMPYSYEKYWKPKFHSRIHMMIGEKHQYLYKGSSGDLIQVEYQYSDSTGKKGQQDFNLPLRGEQAVLKIPAIPYIKSSRASQLKLTLESEESIKIEVTRL